MKFINELPADITLDYLIGTVKKYYYGGSWIYPRAPFQDFLFFILIPAILVLHRCSLFYTCKPLYLFISLVLDWSYHLNFPWNYIN